MGFSSYKIPASFPQCLYAPKYPVVNTPPSHEDLTGRDVRLLRGFPKVRVEMSIIEVRIRDLSLTPTHTTGSLRS